MDEELKSMCQPVKMARFTEAKVIMWNGITWEEKGEKRTDLSRGRYFGQRER